MKNLIKFLPAMAILLASSLAVATTSKTMAPQYYKINGTGDWIPLAGSGIVFGSGSGQYTCVNSPNDCTAEGFDHLGNPIGRVFGNATQNP